MSKKLSVKKGDTVVVLAGKDKKKTGKVLEAYPSKSAVLVEGVNMVTKHQKARSAQQQSGIMHKEAAINVSNVMIICPSCKEATRVAKNTVKAGEKEKNVRVCKNCKAELDK